MLLWVLLIWQAIAKIVAVDGMIPSIFTGRPAAITISASNCTNADIRILEMAKVNSGPKEMQQICVFQDKPELHIQVFERILGVTDNSVSMGSTLEGAYSFAEKMYKKGSQVSLFETNTSFIIRTDQSPIPEGYRRVDLSKTPFAFLETEKFSFVVFSTEEDTVSNRICQKPLELFSLQPIILAAAFLLIYIIYLFYTPKAETHDGVNYWVLDKDLNVLYGPEKDEASWRCAEKAARECVRDNQTSSYVSHLKRAPNGFVFKRIVALPLEGGLSFVLIWWDAVDNDQKYEVGDNFEVEGSISKPVITFSSLRDARPLHIHVQLNDTECVADLDGSVITAFSPYSTLVNVLASMIHNAKAVLNHKTTTTFPEMLHALCETIGAYRALFYDSPEHLVCSYEIDGLEPITEEVAASIPGKVTVKQGFGYMTDLFDDGKEYFVAKLAGKTRQMMLVIALDTQGSIDTYQVMGLPVIAQLTWLLYTVCHQKDQRLKALTVLDSWANTHEQSFFEIAWNRKELVMSKFQGGTMSGVKTVDDLVKLMNEVEEVDSMNFRTELMKTIAEGGSVSRRTVKTQDGSIVFWAAAVRDDIIDDTAVMVLSERCSSDSSSNSLQTMMKNLNIGQFTIADNQIILSDNVILNALGIEAGEKTPLRKIVDPRDYDKLQKILKGERVAIRLLNGQGETRWFSVHGNKTNGIIFGTDQFTENQSDREARVRMIGSSVVVLFWTVDVATDHVHSLFMQPTIWDWLLVDGDAKFIDLTEYIHPDDKYKFEVAHEELVNGDRKEWHDEIRIVKLRGGDYEWYKFVLARGQDNIIQCLALNITKHKEMTHKLNEMSQLRDLMLSCGKIAIWSFLDDDTELPKMSQFDPGLMKVFKMNWKFIEQYVRPEYQDMFREQVKEAFASEQGSIEIDVPLTLDKEMWFSFRGRHRPAVHQILGVVVDITDLKSAYNELEEEKIRAEEANAQKNTFLANMSHEVRTPMNGVFGVLDVLSLQNLTTEQRILVNSLRASSSQLMNLLNETLNLTTIEQGTVDWKPEAFDVRSVLDPICLSFSAQAAKKHISFGIELPNNFPLRIYGDPRLLTQILNTLISNSLKFTKEGSITVKFDWVCEEDQETCILKVIDTGCGMSPEQHMIMLERFARIDKSATEFFGDNDGLGLALVYKIASYLGGTLDLTSPAKGMTATVSFPSQSVMAPYIPPFSDNKKHVVFVMASDENVRKTISDCLAYSSYDVRLLTDPEEIVEASKSAKVDIVFVEGDREQWPRVKHATSRVPGYAPVVCSICEVGQAAYFTHSVPKATLICHVYEFVSMVRFGKISSERKRVEVAKNDKASRILVVEDNKANQFVMKKILQKIGCEFEIAENGRQAIDILETSDFDLIFMDCQMPVLDGIKATQIIRASKQRYSSIPIVALTASAIEGDEQTCRNAGMDGYLAKPVRVQQITNAIQQFHH